MCSHLIRFVLYFAILSVLPVSGKEKQVLFQQIDRQDGLSHNHVRDVVQDQYGFVWIATADGLNRFDGYDVKVYEQGRDSNTLSSSHIYSLVVDTRGQLWVGTADGLHRYQYETDDFLRCHSQMNQLKNLSDKTIITLYEDKNACIWIGTRYGGLNVYDPKKDTLQVYRNNPFNENSLPSDYVTAIIEDSQGRIWVGTDKEGIAVLHPETDRFTHLTTRTHDQRSLSHPTVLSFFLDEDNDLWIGTSFLLNKVLVTNDDPNDFKVSFQHFRNPLVARNSDNRILAITKGGMENELFLSYKNHGLQSFDKTSGAFTAYRNVDHYFEYASPLNINVFFSDRTGLLWMGTKKAGIRQFHPEASLYQYQKHLIGEDGSLPDNLINGLAYDQTENMLLIATDSRGLVVYDLDSRKYQIPGMHDEEETDFPRTTAVMKDRDGHIWVGSTGGIQVYPSMQVLLQHKNQTDFFYHIDELTLLMVNCFFQDSRGFVWVGTQNGLVRINYDETVGDEKDYLIFDYDSYDQFSLPDNKVMAVAEDQQGFIWVGTYKGLCRINPATNEVETYLEGLVYDILLAEFPFLWLGTGGDGLQYFNTETKEVSRLTEADGLPHNTVLNMLDDGLGYIWLTTNKGLARMNKKSRDITRYGRTEGIPAAQFNHGAIANDDSGMLYLGTNQGFLFFQPDELLLDDHAPIINFTDFKCFNQTVKPGDEVLGSVLLDQAIFQTKFITLSHQHNVITFEFAALHFGNPLSNEYRYMLKGFDRDWIYHKGSKPAVTYTNLPPGSYTFTVYASNGVGAWTDQPKEMHIQVRPPFYRTVWFYLLCLVLLGGLIFWLVKIREKRLMEINMLLNYEKELLQTLLDNIPDHIFFKDKNSSFIRINKIMAENLALHHPDEAVGKSDFDFLPPEDAKSTLQEEYRILKKHEKLVHAVVKRKRKGKEAWISVVKVPMYNKFGAVAGIVGISRDITTQKEAEIKIREAEQKAVEADRMKTAFLANMSHEVRTPMNSIVGFSDLLNDPELSVKDRNDYISYIKSNSNTLMCLIDDILDMAKIEANQVAIHQVDFDLNRFMCELLKTFQVNKVNMGKKHLELQWVEEDKTSKRIVQTDPNRLKQIISNLINNAIKFTETGTVSFGYESRSDDALCFFVRDTGVGIAQDMQHAIFERFGRGENALNHVAGVGLGLSISAKLVFLLGGELQVSSKSGDGSVFYFTLPGITT